LQQAASNGDAANQLGAKNAPIRDQQPTKTNHSIPWRRLCLSTDWSTSSRVCDQVGRGGVFAESVAD